MKKTLMPLTLAALCLTGCPGPRTTTNTTGGDAAAEKTAQPPTVEAPAPLVIDKVKVKEGDRVGSFTVKSVQRAEGTLLDVTLSGELEVSGKYHYSDFTGDGDGWIFEIDAEAAGRLPYLSGEGPDQIRMYVLSNSPEALTLLGKGPGIAVVVLDELSIGERQIDRRARLVRALKVTPTTPEK